MRKFRWIGLIVVTLAVLVFGAAVPALAHPGDNDGSAYASAYVDGPTLTRVAEALGLTPEELTAELQAGKTLSEVAQEQNVPEGEVIDAIIAPYAEQLKLQVRYGYITQEQSDAFLDAARERASLLLEQDLSGAGGNTEWWGEMEERCEDMMGSYGGSYGYGGMMGGGMIGNYGRGYGMMGPGMMGGWYRQGYGSGSMMGPGYNYNDSGAGWNTPAPAPARGSNGWTSVFGRFWNGITSRGNAPRSGGMMGGW